MHIVEQGRHVHELMVPKITSRLRKSIDDMVKGGLIQTTSATGRVVYTWRDNADNFRELQLGEEIGVL